LLSSIRCNASAASASPLTVLQRVVMKSPMRSCWKSMPRSSARRRSPSVKMPSRCPPGSVTVVMPKPLAVISSSASRITVSGGTRGTSRPWCMISLTRSSSLRPRAPPGCENAKSSAEKPRASSSAIASASPITSATVVLEVGARSSGQASASTPTSRFTSARRARVDSGLPVMAISRAPMRLISGRIVRISGVVPEFDSASTTSLPVIMPRSPWLASPGCT